MTTYYQPLQRESDRRWDYTSGTGSGGTCPIGYCAGWKEPPDGDECGRLDAQFGPGFALRLSADIEKRREHQAKYHTNGHEAAAEAGACYRQWELDNDLKLYAKPIEEAKELHRCVADGCGEFTAGLACLGQHRNWYLCDAHRNRDVVEKLASKP